MANTAKPPVEESLSPTKAREIVSFGILAASSVIAAALPVRGDVWLARAGNGLLSVLGAARKTRIAGRMQKLLSGGRLRLDEAVAMAERWQSNKLEVQLGQLRGIWRSWGTPRIELTGREHIDRALAKGNGVILWIMATGGPLIYKQGLAAAGLPIVHLSSFMHGAPRKSVFGVGTVAPFRRRAEDPFVLERVSIPRDGSLQYLVTLKERLTANACVTIHGEYRGRQNVRAALLGHGVDFAMGAPSLASRCGAELLTVHTVRLGAGHYRVVVDEPIRIDSRDRKEFVRLAVNEFARRLQSRIEEHPELWDGWGDPPPLHRLDEEAVGGD